MELKSVSIVSRKLLSISCKWTLVYIFSKVDASREVFEFSGIFVKANKNFNIFVVNFEFLYSFLWYFCDNFKAFGKSIWVANIVYCF